MLSIARVANVSWFIAALTLAASGIAIGAGMGGVGAAGGMGGGGMMSNSMNNMMGSYSAASTGSAVTDPNHPGATADPSMRNFSHTGLRMPMRVSKAWQDLPLSDPGAGGALTPVPATRPPGNTSK